MEESILAHILQLLDNVVLAGTIAEVLELMIYKLLRSVDQHLFVLELLREEVVMVLRRSFSDLLLLLNLLRLLCFYRNWLWHKSEWLLLNLGGLSDGDAVFRNSTLRLLMLDDGGNRLFFARCFGNFYSGHVVQEFVKGRDLLDGLRRLLHHHL